VCYKKLFNDNTNSVYRKRKETLLGNAHAMREHLSPEPFVWKKEKVSGTVKVEENVQSAMKRRKAKWMGHILCRNCLMKQVIEGKTEG
jgi:hypothetical protein